MGQNKGTLCHRCAERYGEALFAALRYPEIPFIGVMRPPVLLSPSRA